MSAPLLFALAEDHAFAATLANELGAELGLLEARDFPDGETYLRIETSPAAREVVVVATLHDPNRKTLPIYLLACAARQCGATRVGLVAPYLAYMRQDAVFHDGESVTARSFATLVSSAFDWLVTVEPHLHRIRRLSEIYNIPADVVDVTPDLAAWIADHVPAPVIVGPDDESRQWAASVATAAGVPYLVLAKTRRGDRDVEVSVPGLSAYRGRTPVLVDDIISTGRTMAAAARHIRATAHLATTCVGVHAVFAPGAAAALESAGAAPVITTNTIPHPSNRIDVVPAVSRMVRQRLSAPRR